MSSKMSQRRPTAAPAASKKAAPQKNQQKRKREEESESDEEMEMDLDAMVDGDDDEEDEDSDEEDLDIDPQEIAAMAHLYGKKKKQTTAADEEDDDDEDDYADEDGIGGDSSSDDGEEAGDEGTGTIARPAKKKAKLTFLNNKAALLDKLGDIALPASYPWIETLQITTKKSFFEATNQAADAHHDDLKREAAFYELSLNAASEGLQQLTDLSIPFRIPPDFFAERVKPDKHMNRIKDKLIEEQRKMVAVSERKLDKETRKFAKEVQSAKLQEKSAEKKASLAAAGRMRKVDDGELGIERSILPGVQAHLAANRADEQARLAKKSAKREAKDKKYGHGGKKRNVRKNDKESASSGKDYANSKNRQNFGGFNDQKPGSYQSRSQKSGGGAQFNKNGSSFTPRGFSSARGGRGGARGGRGGRGGSKPNRPGKAARSQSRK